MTTKNLHPDCYPSSSYKLLSEDEKYQHQIVWWWFQLLQLNPAYEEYCEAIRENDHEQASKLDVKPLTLSELFTDWGDVHSPDLHGMHDPGLLGWQKWLARKHNLFFNVKVQWLNQDAIQWDADSLVFAVPNVSDKATQLKLFKDFLEHSHQNFPAVKEDNAPKYPLRKDLIKRMVHMLDKASLINDLLMFDDDRKGILDEHREYSEEQIEEVILDLERELDAGFGWYRSEREGNFASKDNIKQIRRLNKEFEQWIEDSAKGLFPARK